MRKQRLSQPVIVKVKKYGTIVEARTLVPETPLTRKERQALHGEIKVPKRVAVRRDRAHELAETFGLPMEEAKERALREQQALNSLKKIGKSNRKAKKIKAARRYQKDGTMRKSGSRMIRGRGPVSGGGGPGTGKRR